MPFFNFLKPSTNSSRLERWLGKENVNQLSQSMVGFHGPIPILVGNTPGRVFATNDGDFVGNIKGGHFASLADFTWHKLEKKIKQMKNSNTLYAGFSSLSDLISEATSAGKSQNAFFAKTGVTGVANVANSLWDVGAQPAAGGSTAASGGLSYDNASSGGLYYTAPQGTDTTHITTITSVGTVANNLLLLHDRVWAVNHDTVIQSPTINGVPTRYQDSTAINNFIGIFVTTALGGTPGTYQLVYTDENGIDTTGTAQTLVAASIARRFPFAATVGNGWFYPMLAGDYGVRKITKINQNVATTTGKVDVVICKPLVWIPQGIANFPVIIDGINSAFNLIKVADAGIPNSGCLAFMEINKGATTATSYTGTVTLVAG